MTDDAKTSQTAHAAAAGPGYDAKGLLHRYLKAVSDALVWKLEGLDEYAVRRPLTATGTNLLGLVKHVAGVNSEYFGSVFGRPFPEALPWLEQDVADNADFWATASESREYIIGVYQRVWAHTEATIEALDLDATGRVPWWPPERNTVTLYQILVHMVAELNRHTGHADILREQLDDSAGLNQRNANLPDHDEAWWANYRGEVEAAARQASGREG